MVRFTPGGSHLMAAGGLMTVERLSTSFQDAMARLLRGPAEVALIGFPNHPNVGDAAIWAGERAWLRTTAHSLVYVADLLSYSRRSLSRVLGRDGVVLLHGGGNLGDLWPHHQALRERVIQDFPHHRIIQLPQTVHFQSKSALMAAQRAFSRGSDLTLLIRDRESLRKSSEWFENGVELVPDPAFMLGPQRPACAPQHDVLWLARTDTEASDPLRSPHRNAFVADWIADDAPFPLGVDAARVRQVITRWGQRSRRVPPATRLAQRALLPAFDALANLRVTHGLRLLSSSRIVVTDRLHAHILCLLLGTPHVIVETGYGKIRGFYETWTSESSIVRFADRPEEATKIAARLRESATRASA
jgi:exopolysaccharide biosynthesis predicted pyruvyltransferase EpsI